MRTKLSIEEGKRVPSYKEFKWIRENSYPGIRVLAFMELLKKERSKK